MKAGYLMGKWIKKKLKSWSKESVINYLATTIGVSRARKIVRKVVEVGASSAATYVATLLGATATVAGPIGSIIGLASGWL